MSALKHSEERLMKVLLAPVISEKATMVAEKNEQVVFLVARCDQARNQGRRRTAVQGGSGIGASRQPQGKQALGNGMAAATTPSVLSCA
jgi:hypothetical protein